ncbi:hypothetical protein P4H94_09170 [Paenibacillus macerans]|uniref:hypothetical protein n=1 Tax=Paenibacillus macerans TaxID=44252 RepID=UPI00056BDC50|nr:hypothetical protein [Paenibacillus macerans]MEC0137039.1 hypothetical protein [Paenibacillus macerans]GBK64373.1 hypothetical protein PbDSM24746_43770 [Paenibacillus macerans]GBK70459.1 hypothetical protein PbJCM17693_41670 [Paenibacillus macerans]GIP13656.1 hypothetical protein J1TS5_58260 [Paenibacillus macerans]
MSSFLYWWSFFNRLIFILSPILFALFDFQIVNTTFWQILIFWLVHNLIALFYALFFMIGRRAYRENERIRAQEDVRSR